eukprot:7239814-Alexandrium_andersonii.AAC.1
MGLPGHAAPAHRQHPGRAARHDGHDWPRARCLIGLHPPLATAGQQASGHAGLAARAAWLLLLLGVHPANVLLVVRGARLPAVAAQPHAPDDPAARRQGGP